MWKTFGTVGVDLVEGRESAKIRRRRRVRGFYEDRILPHLVHLSMRQETFNAYRQRIISAAEGNVLEIGIGSGLTGFRVEQIETGYMQGPKPMTFMYEGEPPALSKSSIDGHGVATLEAFNHYVEVFAIICPSSVAVLLFPTPWPAGRLPSDVSSRKKGTQTLRRLSPKAG